MEMTMKIIAPEGYEIDKEKSTLENIVFKKIDDVVIRWDNVCNGVIIKDGGEHFIVDASKPCYICSWHEAVRFDKSGCFWKLPTIKQLKVLSKHINKVNEIIRENNGYEIKGWLWSCEGKNLLYALVVGMTSGSTRNYRKNSLGYVRAVSTL